MTSDRTGADPAAAKFVHGSIMRHVLIMTFTGAAGLMALFLVDLADLYFLSLLGQVEVAAAIGYAGTIVFFTTSIGIGLSIAATALVSRAIGQGDRERARRLSSNAHLFAVVVAIVIATLVWVAIPYLLVSLGARGTALELATSYLQIVVPSLPLLVLGMCASGVLRAVGDARRAMYITLSGALVNAILDPILIFGLDLGVDGAAMASVASRFAVVVAGANGVVRVHGLFERPQFSAFHTDFPPILLIAVPAILTNLATPVGNAFVTLSVAASGDDAVAGWAIIGRIIPVALGFVFALSGAIGPILGQNFGAEQYGRMRRALTDSLIVSGVYIAAVWLVLALCHDLISSAFNAGPAGRELIALFSTALVPLFAFFAALFIANAAFNNLGRPHYSTLFNWGRATLGTIPFVYFGAKWFGAGGAIAGNMVGSVLFGTVAVWACYQLIGQLAADSIRPSPDAPALERRQVLWPFSTRRG